MSTIDVSSREKAPRRTNLFDDKEIIMALREQKTSTKAVEKLVDQEKARTELVKMRNDALALYESLSMELDIETEPKYNAPNTWSYYSVQELQRGDAMLIDGVIYVYLEKMAWWRSKTANILVAQHHNPDKQKRVGEVDFVYAYKGYVLAKQMAKIGVTI
jgi:hypothetical protein